MKEIKHRVRKFLYLFVFLSRCTQQYYSASKRGRITSKNAPIFIFDLHELNAVLTTCISESWGGTLAETRKRYAAWLVKRGFMGNVRTKTNNLINEATKKK